MITPANAIASILEHVWPAVGTRWHLFGNAFRGGHRLSFRYVTLRVCAGQSVAGARAMCCLCWSERRAHSALRVRKPALSQVRDLPLRTHNRVCAGQGVEALLRDSCAPQLRNPCQIGQDSVGHRRSASSSSDQANMSHPATTILTGCHPGSARGSEVQMAPSESELLLGVMTVVASLRLSVERGERHSAHQVADFVDGEATNRWRVSVRRLQPALNCIEEPCSARRGTLHRSDPWSPELRADRRRPRHALAMTCISKCLSRHQLHSDAASQTLCRRRLALQRLVLFQAHE